MCGPSIGFWTFPRRRRSVELHASVGDVQAGVLSSSRYPQQLADLAARMKVPVLMLHGTADRLADGGTEFTKVEMARSFERALRAAGKTVEAVYYEGADTTNFDSSVRYQDELQRSLAFFEHHLSACRDAIAMCNLYSITTNQAAITALFRVINRYVGNLAPMPGVFPDYPAPVVRNSGGRTRNDA